MNLAHHVDVLFRHKAFVAAGLFLGVVFAILAVYQVPSMERRGSEKWSVESQFLVTQSGFPEGRVTLPNTGTDVPPVTVTPDAQDRPSQTFADPGRLSSLAVLYSAIAVSDQVRRRLPGPPARDQIQAITLDASGNGSNYLPIIRLVTTAATAPAAARLNAETFNAIKDLLASRQEANNIEPMGRVKLSLLTAPSGPFLISAPSMTPAVLAFLLCLIATIAAVHVREGLWLRRKGSEPDDAFGDSIGNELTMLRRGEFASISGRSRRAG
jgi:hypothetical protein